MTEVGRPKRYRERIEFEMVSVEAKGIRGLIIRMLVKDFGRSRLEAEALSERSLGWLQALGARSIPGQMLVSVPATPSRKYARQRRRTVTITAVDVGEDTEVWRSYGLAAMQRRRLLRWLYEIHRQGGWASLAEVAAWANLTPTALGARLAPVRKLGIWLPHIGGPPARDESLALDPWLVDRYLRDGRSERLRAIFGITVGGWESILRRFVQITEMTRAGTAAEGCAMHLGLSPLEGRQFLAVAARHKGRPALQELRASYGASGDLPLPQLDGIESELVQNYRFSPVAARLYHQWLKELAARMGTEELREGEMVFFAIAAEEGARAKLAEARHVPVRLRYITEDDLREGPYGECRTRVSGLKFSRILRYATSARAQGALLTLPDLAVLMGIHVDAIRRQLAAHPHVVVPTRGRVKDIGRGVTHRARIVELYLQMHTETEIVERTGHTYESVEAYLREFARIVSLADQGMNAVMIRRVTGRSLALVEAYLDLYRRYDRPEYHFRLSQIRNVFAREDILGGKKGRLFPSRTGGAGR